MLKGTGRGQCGRRRETESVLVIIPMIRGMIEAKASRTKVSRRDRNVTCDKWQRNRVFGGGLERGTIRPGTIYSGGGDLYRCSLIYVTPEYGEVVVGPMGRQLQASAGGVTCQGSFKSRKPPAASM